MLTIMEFLTPIMALVTPFIMQFIKKDLKLEGRGALLATVVVSIVFALFGAWATGAFTVAFTVSTFTAIFTSATLIYKLILTSETVEKVLPESLKN